ncbi:MAG: transglutaminase family protein [Burkholderiales bacterium]|nr:MAG: transglutaminase family protein [Burkholderiales bacterium]
MSVVHLPGLPQATETGRDIGPYLAPTYFLDYEAPAVQRFVRDAVGDAQDQRTRVVRLFYAVRDRIRYDPYRISYEPQAYRASRIVEDGYGWCVSKAGLLAACARAVGIPSAIGLADVVNHLNTEKLRARMGGVDVFYDHGYAALLLDGRWVKAVPAFNIELCERFGVRPTEFDGRVDALYQEHDAHGRLHMQYLADHGTWSDLPLQQVRDDFTHHYPGSAFAAGAATASVASEERFENETPLDG